MSKQDKNKDNTEQTTQKEQTTQRAQATQQTDQQVNNDAAQERDTTNDDTSTDNQQGQEPKIKLEDLSIEQLRNICAFQQQLHDALAKENEQLIAKQDELRKLLAKDNSYLDQLVAIKADFDSYKLRIRADAEQYREEGVLKAIEKVFPFIDTLEKARVDIKDGKAFELIYRQFCKVLFEMGITELEVLNKPFNPQTANALAEREVQERKGEVIEVYQKGFMYKDKVIRYAQVIVGK
ncbi:MAG: nucleotide exchange factor GrpE [Clostridia bacterium]|nr:nucleotide exchange factor GrpE [Clostridia bacterium]